MTKERSSEGPAITRAEFLKGIGAGLAFGLAGVPIGAAAATDTPLKRPVPKTKVPLHVIGLGTAKSFGFPQNEAGFAERKEVVRVLLDGGASVIDTSPTYGRAEPVLGRAMAELGRRDEVFLATKISIRGEDRGVAQNRQSASNLKTDRFDLLQVHNLVDTAAHLRTMRRLREQGRVRHIGITHFFSSAHGELAAVARREQLDFVQFNYSLADRKAERELLPLCRDLGLACMINVPFARGALFRAVRGRKVPEWAQEFDAESWGQFFLKFVLAHEAVTVAIPGTSRPKHMRDNLGAALGRLPTPAHKKRMIALLDSL